MSRQYTTEEIRQQVIDHARYLVQYWDKQVDPSTTQRERISGALFSFLTMLDGCTGLPAFCIAPCPHPDDKAYHIENGDNYYPERPEWEHDITNGAMLHDLFYENGQP